MTSKEVLTKFLEESPWGDTSEDGRVRFMNRCLWVDGELLALRSRADNTYVNGDHPNRPAVLRLRRVAKNVLYVSRKEVQACLNEVQPRGDSNPWT